MFEFIFLFMQKVIELSSSHDSGLAAIVGHSEYLKNVHEVLIFISRVVLDRTHLLEETVEVANEATASGTLNVRVHLCLMKRIEE